MKRVNPKDYYKKQGLTKPLTVYVSEETHKALEKLAESEERSLQTVVRRVLDGLIQKDGK